MNGSESQQVNHSACQGWPRLGLLASMILALLMIDGCSIRRFAVNRLGDALASGGKGFSTDDDPDLIRDAAPFSLKTMEALLAESPNHVGLRTAAASGFTQYAFAFVQSEADEREATDSTASEHLRQRARRLYLRARNHAFSGLEVHHHGFELGIRQKPAQALVGMTRQDVPLLYWLGASWAAAIAQSKDQPDLIGDLPLVEAVMQRALDLDDSWNHGALHGFFIIFEPLRPGSAASAPAKADDHFNRAVALSGHQLAGPYVGLAEGICVNAQDRKRFESLLQTALTINPDTLPEYRLENLIMQRRARWLLGRIDELFVTKTKTAP